MTRGVGGHVKGRQSANSAPLQPTVMRRRLQRCEIKTPSSVNSHLGGWDCRASTTIKSTNTNPPTKNHFEVPDEGFSPGDAMAARGRGITLSRAAMTGADSEPILTDRSALRSLSPIASSMLSASLSQAARVATISASRKNQIFDTRTFH